jgi:hypothetical protein
MFKASKPIIFAAVAVLLSSMAAFAQTGGGAGGASGGATGGAAGTNSAGTANSSGGMGRTTGAGPGGAPAVDGKPATGDANIDAQDRAVDRKVKSICKGC